ncbi:MAG: SCP2 sterol-binding domain-containing protein [Nitrospira sp.]|nr:SCP2 sterol-binding domain-containing protein [Nitrospira sp.]
MKPTTPKEWLASLSSMLDKDAADGLDAAYQFNLRGARGGQYHLLVHNGACEMKEGIHADPHVTLSMDGDDCIRLLNGQISGMAMAMSGRVQIDGDISLAMRLKSLFPGIGR